MKEKRGYSYVEGFEMNVPWTIIVQSSLTMQLSYHLVYVSTDSLVAWKESQVWLEERKSTLGDSRVIAMVRGDHEVVTRTG